MIVHPGLNLIERPGSDFIPPTNWGSTERKTFFTSGYDQSVRRGRYNDEVGTGLANRLHSAQNRVVRHTSRSVPVTRASGTANSANAVPRYPRKFAICCFNSSSAAWV